MIDLNMIPEESSPVDQGPEMWLAGILGRMEKRVAIRAVVDLSGEKDRETASSLRAVVSVGPNLELELCGPDETGQVPELNTAWLPITGLCKGGAYRQAAFHGVPEGREIDSFVLVVYNLAGPGQEVTKGARRKVRRLGEKTSIKICASSACHRCPLVAIVCQQIALPNPSIEAETTDTAFYGDLVVQYDIKWVPMMILNDSRVMVGNETIDEIVTSLKQ